MLRVYIFYAYTYIILQIYIFFYKIIKLYTRIENKNNKNDVIEYIYK